MDRNSKFSQLHAPVQSKHSLWSLPVFHICPQARSTKGSCNNDTEHAYFASKPAEDFQSDCWFSTQFHIKKYLQVYQPSFATFSEGKKKKRSNKSVLAQIHFTYLSIPEIPMLGQNSLLCPTHPVKRKTKSKREIQRLESHPSDGAFSSYKKKMGNHIPT